MEEGTPLDGYVRVSRTRGREGASFISPDVQRTEISRWAEYHKVRIPVVHEDLDWSGGTVDRPGFQKALARIEARETRGIVVSKLDRFARSLSAAHAAIDRIQAAGGTFVSVADQFDLSTSQGRLMFNIMGSFAQFERDRITEQWQTARRLAVERGVHISSRTPTGYVRADDGKLQPHPQDAEVIRAVFEQRASGTSWKQLGALLDSRGVEGPYKAVTWTTRAIEHIIRNRVYLGEARHGEYVNPGAHPPIVDRVTWERAQRAPLAPVARSSEPALLAGLLRCAGCRHLLKPDTQNMRGDRGKVRIYRCRGHHASGRCEGRAAVLGSIIEPWVVSRFFAHLQNLQVERVEEDARFESLEREADAALADLVAYRDDTRILAALGSERFVEGLQGRIERLDQADAELAQASAELGPGVGDVDELRKQWPSIPVAARQKMLRAVVDAVMLRSVGQSNVPIGDRAFIFWRGQLPNDFPRRGRRVPLGSFDWPPAGAGVHLPHDRGERFGGS